MPSFLLVLLLTTGVTPSLWKNVSVSDDTRFRAVYELSLPECPSEVCILFVEKDISAVRLELQDECGQVIQSVTFIEAVMATEKREPVIVVSRYWSHKLFGKKDFTPDYILAYIQHCQFPEGLEHFRQAYLKKQAVVSI